MSPRPLFVFGIARGGTNLVARMLDAHPRVAVALDPLLPLFKSLRNAMIAANGLGVRFDPACPFQDHYGVLDGAAQLDLIMSGTLGLPLPGGALAGLQEALAARAALEDAELPGALSQVQASSYDGLIRAILSVIASARAGDLEWAGTKELWTLDFLPAIARSFPDARFVVIERDPRGIIASYLAMAKRDPTQAAHLVSILRHWRKGVVLARHYSREPRLAPRLIRVQYEDLARDPEAGAHRLCGFLDITSDDAMLHLERTMDRMNGGRWAGNSSFSDADGRISTVPVERWREVLPVEVRRAVEFYCGPEMQLAGYPRVEQRIFQEAALVQAIGADVAPGSWRSDSGDFIADFGLELLRWEILKRRGQGPPDLIRRCFLFEWVAAEMGDPAWGAVECRHVE